MSIAKVLGIAPTRKFTKTDAGWRVDVTPHPFSGIAKTATVELTDDQFKRVEEWINGFGMIQELLPDLTRDDREILMTGIGPDDFARMFPPEED